MISIVVTGRNDDYAGGFRDRLFRTCRHNTSRLAAAGIEHEFVLVEWNPVEGRPLLARSFCETFANARAFVVPPEMHLRHVTNPHMPFDEMAAKNVGIRRARGEWTMATNADILIGAEVVERLRRGGLRRDALYRAHRLDVPSDVVDEEIDRNPRTLASGEGSLPPCYYLGAGGDFCLAATPLWHRLGGFNQRVRFSTRAKDWQFFLSAAAQGIDIEFIGKVFHLDHEGGFRNATREERDGVGAHFGGQWDIEFGLPLDADRDWGLPGLLSREVGARVEELCPPPAIEQVSGRGDVLGEYLAWPAGVPDEFSAALAHAVVLTADGNGPLVVEPAHPKEAVAAAGMAAVARGFGIDVRVDWDWPPLDGFRPPTAPGGDECAAFVRLAPAGARWELVGPDGVRRRTPLPRRLRCENPPHNPMLGRRLLRAWLRLRELGASRLAIYGGGGHTEELLRWGIPDRFSVETILVSGEGGGQVNGIPVRKVAAVDRNEVDAVLLSSIPYEAEMASTAARLGFETVLPLWSDWPRRFWGGGAPA